MTFQYGGVRGAQGVTAYPTYDTLSNRPAANTQPDKTLYVATDVAGGTLYQVESASWVAVATGVTAAPQLHGASHEAGGSDDLYIHYGHASSTRIDSYPRHSASADWTAVNGTTYICYTTAPYAVLAANMLVNVGTVAAVGLTLVRAGIYTLDGSNNLTLVAATADCHASGATRLSTGASEAFALHASDVYTMALALAGDLTTPLSNYQLARGTRYAFAIICYSSGSPTMNKFTGLLNNGQGQLVGALTPKMTGSRTSRTDLDGSMTAANSAASGAGPWIAAST